MFGTLFRNWHLVTSLAKREIAGRYRGSFLGILWSFLHPLLMLGVYTFVFGVVLKTKWTEEGGSTAQFALVLFCGMMMFSLFAECVNRAPSLVLSNLNYVKRVVFPLEILVWVALATGLFHLLISFLVWIAVYLAVVGVPKPTILLFPLVVIPVAFLTLGASWLLASLGVYLRDSMQIVGVLTAAMMFLSPIFYPTSALPAEFRWILNVNPLSLGIEYTRDVLIHGRIPSAAGFAAYTGMSAVIAWSGFAWFQKTREGFADVV